MIRIGQTQKVLVTTSYIKFSIDGRVWGLQNYKIDKAKQVTGDIETDALFQKINFVDLAPDICDTAFL